MMRGKRFRTRRDWHNSRLWAMACGFMLLVGGLLALQQDNRFLLWVLLSACAAGAIVAWRRDRAHDAVYSFDGDQVLLRGKDHARRIQLDEVADLSLIDRMAARDYIKQKLRTSSVELGRTEQRDAERRFMRYCTVDIGLTSFTFGVGRRMTDQLRDAKRDLVLLRLRNGEAMLLSPLYNHDLVESLGRVLQERAVA